jgi:hypothetical protein
MQLLVYVSYVSPELMMMNMIFTYVAYQYAICFMEKRTILL